MILTMTPSSLLHAVVSLCSDEIPFKLDVAFRLQEKKAAFEEGVPSFAVCNILPTLAYAPNAPPDTATLTHVDALDSTCPSDVEFYITFLDESNMESPVGNLWGCPVRPQEPDRCVAPSDTDICTASSSLTFPRSSIQGCYCKNVRNTPLFVPVCCSSECMCVQVLSDYISRYGVISGAKRLWKDEGQVCLKVFRAFLFVHTASPRYALPYSSRSSIWRRKRCWLGLPWASCSSTRCC